MNITKTIKNKLKLKIPPGAVKEIAEKVKLTPRAVQNVIYKDGPDLHGIWHLLAELVVKAEQERQAAEKEIKQLLDQIN
jgi:hypothetical protein